MKTPKVEEFFKRSIYFDIIYYKLYKDPNTPNGAKWILIVNRKARVSNIEVNSYRFSQRIHAINSFELKWRVTKLWKVFYEEPNS